MKVPEGPIFDQLRVARRDLEDLRIYAGGAPQKLTYFHRPNHPSKTFVFEKARRIRKELPENGLSVSQNPFLISASQKVRVRLSFERVHDDQT